jgi:hypothetical protein
MQGLFFSHITPDPNNPQRMLIKSGVVKSAVGPDRWLLEFEARGYNFSNILPAAALENFAFFETREARATFIRELVAANTKAEPPAEDEAQ